MHKLENTLPITATLQLLMPAHGTMQFEVKPVQPPTSFSLLVDEHVMPVAGGVHLGRARNASAAVAKPRKSLYSLMSSLPLR